MKVRLVNDGDKALPSYILHYQEPGEKWRKVRLARALRSALSKHVGGSPEERLILEIIGQGIEDAFNPPSQATMPEIEDARDFIAGPRAGQFLVLLGVDDDYIDRLLHDINETAR